MSVRVLAVRPNTTCPACKGAVDPERYDHRDPACDRCGAVYHPACVGLADGEARRPCGCAGSDDEREEARERLRYELLERLPTGATFLRAEEVEAEALAAGLLRRDVLPDEDDLERAARRAWGARLMPRHALYLLTDGSTGYVMARAADVDDAAGEAARSAAVWAVRWALGAPDAADPEDVYVDDAGTGPTLAEARRIAWDHWPDCLGDVDGGPLSAWPSLVDADEGADLAQALAEVAYDYCDSGRAADMLLTVADAGATRVGGRAAVSRAVRAELRRQLDHWYDRDAGEALLARLVVGV